MRGKAIQNAKKLAELMCCFETHSIKYLFSFQLIVVLQDYVISHSNRFKGFKSCSSTSLPSVALLSLKLPFENVHLKEIDLHSRL